MLDQVVCVRNSLTDLMAAGAYIPRWVLRLYYKLATVSQARPRAALRRPAGRPRPEGDLGAETASWGTPEIFRTTKSNALAARACAASRRSASRHAPRIVELGWEVSSNATW